MKPSTNWAHLTHGPDSAARKAGCACRTCDGPGLDVLALQLGEVVRAQQNADSRTRHLTWFALVVIGTHVAALIYSAVLFERKGIWALVGIGPAAAGAFFALIAMGSLVAFSSPILNMVRLNDAKQMTQLRVLGSRTWHEEQLRLLGGLVDRQLARLNRNADLINFAISFHVIQLFAQGVLALIPG